MKHTNKKGFTLVELIIVIAVIGVLAAILIPVFSNVIGKANAKSAMSDARNTLSNYLVSKVDNPSLPDNGEVVIMVKKAGRYYVFGYVNNKITAADNNGDKGYECTLDKLVEEGGGYNVSKAVYDAGMAEIAADPSKTPTEVFEDKGIMYLVRNDTRGIGDYVDLSDWMDPKADAESIHICEGVLLSESSTLSSLEVPEATTVPSTAPSTVPSTAPATEAPATEAPATEPPATEPPATEPPATEAPTTDPGVEQSPNFKFTLKFKDVGGRFTIPSVTLPYYCPVGEEVTVTVEYIRDTAKLWPEYPESSSSQQWYSITEGGFCVADMWISGDPVNYWNYTRPDIGTTTHSIDIWVCNGNPGMPWNDMDYSKSINSYTTKTLNSVVLISTEDELASINPAAPNTYYLRNNITLTDTWTPIGFGEGNSAEDVAFAGTFEGNNFTISGLQIALGDAIVDEQAQTTTYYQNVGLFSMIGEGGSVHDLTVRTTENGVEGGLVVGILAGQNAGTIDYVTITGPVNSEDPTVTDSSYVGAYAYDYYSYVGSIVGFNEGTISNCSVPGAKVYGYVEVGGIVGENTGVIYNTEIVVDDINAQATETTLQNMGMNYIGGFVGLNDSGYIHDCTVAFSDSGIVKGYYYVGGFAGMNVQNNTNTAITQDNRAKIADCTITGSEVYGRRYVGGFCGFNESASSTDKAKIINCDITVYGINSIYYSDATLASILADTGFVGGHTGYNNAIIESSKAAFYSEEAVGFQKVGGFVGQNDTYGDITLSAAKSAYAVGYQFAGGFCGENYGSISRSFADIYGLNMSFTNNDLTQTQPTFIGGLIGASRGTVANCYAISQSVVKGYYYVGGLMGANYSNAQSQGSATNCFSHVAVLGYTAAYSVAYIDNATMTGIFFVATSGTSTGATRVTESAIMSAGFEDTCGWSTDIWSFGNGYPQLVNNTRS